MAKSEAARRKNNETRKEIYRWYKEHGICTMCGRAYAEPGRVYCAPCNRKYNARRAQLDPGNEKHKAYNRQRKADLIAQGLCVWCGKRPHAEGHRMCPTCRAKDRESKQKWNIMQRIKRDADRAREASL